jgi:hypothetical protein
MSEQDPVLEDEQDEQEAEEVLGDDAVEPRAAEADVLEQSRLVDGRQAIVVGERPDDVPEADWLEQSIEESDTDDR